MSGGSDHGREPSCVCRVSEPKVHELVRPEPPQRVVLIRFSVGRLTIPAGDDKCLSAQLRIADVQLDGTGISDGDTDLLPALPPYRLIRCLSVLHVSADEVPHVWVPPTARVSVAQKYLIAADQCRNHDLLHRLTSRVASAQSISSVEVGTVAAGSVSRRATVHQVEAA